MIEVLHVYRDVELWRKAGLPPEVVGVLSYDEKPGIQAISNTAPDLPPVPGRHTSVGRDHEYKRHGTVSLLAGIELLSGEVLGLVRDRHRSAEFIEFLQLADQHYLTIIPHTFQNRLARTWPACPIASNLFSPPNTAR